MRAFGFCRLRWGYRILIVKYSIEEQKIELELEYFWKTLKQNMKLRSRIG